MADGDWSAKVKEKEEKPHAWATFARVQAYRRNIYITIDFDSHILRLFVNIVYK